jgi:hypothetical protein
MDFVTVSTVKLDIETAETVPEIAFGDVFRSSATFVASRTFRSSILESIADDVGLALGVEDGVAVFPYAKGVIVSDIASETMDITFLFMILACSTR